MSAGARSPVLLAHGWGGSFDATYGACGWREALAAAGRDVLALDLPGHGRAPASHDPADYADLAGALLARMPDNVVDAVGFSLGSKLLIEIECRAPGRFRRLALGGVGANVFAPERGVEAVAEVLESGNADGASAHVRMMLDYARPSGGDPKALAAVLRRAPNPVITTQRLVGMRARVLVVNGAEDRGVAPSEALSEFIPKCETLILPGVGHVDLPASAAFREAAIDFVSS